MVLILKRKSSSSAKENSVSQQIDKIKEVGRDVIGTQHNYSTEQDPEVVEQNISFRQQIKRKDDEVDKLKEKLEKSISKEEEIHLSADN